MSEDEKPICTCGPNYATTLLCKKHFHLDIQKQLKYPNKKAEGLIWKGFLNRSKDCE